MDTQRTFKKVPAALAAAFTLLLLANTAFAGGRQVTINGERLSEEEILQIERALGTPVQNGNYWYDPASGRWGKIANPVAPEGQTPPTREVIVNGKKLSPEEIRQIEQTTGLRVASGKYWLDEATGLWGRVGSPPQGRIGAPGNHNSNIQNTPGGGTTEFHGDGSWSFGNPNTGGGMIYDPNIGGSWQDKVWIPPR